MYLEKCYALYEIYNCYDILSQEHKNIYVGQMMMLSLEFHMAQENIMDIPQNKFNLYTRTHVRAFETQKTTESRPI